MSNSVFQSNLLRYMDKKCMNQADIVHSVGVTKATVSMWCNGITKPRGESLIKLAKCLSVTPSMLMNEYNSLFQYDEEKLLLDFRMLSAEGKQKAIERMEELKQLYWYDKDIAK